MAEQHGFIIEVEVIEPGDYGTAHRHALETGDFIWQNIGEASVVIRPTGETLFQGIPNGVYCEGCEGHVIPGIRWPTATDGDTSHEWVERCDTCERYESDDEAAQRVVDEYKGVADKIETGHAIAGAKTSPSPYVDVDVDR